MRKIITAAAVIFMMAGLLIPAQAERGRPILYTAYRQMGWGDTVQVGCIDENGEAWVMEGHDADLKWPYGAEKQIAYLRESGHLTSVGKLSHDDLFALKSLISSVIAPEDKPSGWMCDAGTESSYAVRYDRQGNPEAVLLGMTGDDLLENTDPNAQALYAKLRRFFPFVRSYGGEMTEGWGFQPVPLAAFCHLEGIDWDGVTVSAVYEDCEAGPRKMDLSDEDTRKILNEMKHGVVTGKENAMAVTGGTRLFSFYDREGNHLGSIELYGGLLVRNDGMYNVE